MLPDFFLAGAPKAGTTSMFHYLQGHPEVFMCPVKEPNFFSFPDIRAQHLYYTSRDIRKRSRYEALFDAGRHATVRGEASVSYLFYPKVPERIHALLPEARIIIILREPATRGFSHYLMDARLGYITCSFEDIIHRRTDSPLLPLFYQQVVELGFYHDQVKRYLDLFGHDQVRIFLTDDLEHNPRAVLESTCALLGISPKSMPETSTRHNVYRQPRNRLVGALYANRSLRKLFTLLLPDRARKGLRNALVRTGDKPVLSEESRHYLATLYREDIEKLSTLIDRDLSTWLPGRTDESNT